MYYIKWDTVHRNVENILAKRDFEIYCNDEDGIYTYNFQKMNYEIGQYIIFMRKSGLFDLLENHIISNLSDYITGVESGLSSNGRKNRGGHQMEKLVESYIKKLSVEYYKEMDTSSIKSKWNINISDTGSYNINSKRWDFVVKTNKYIYVIETNFYSGSGSKLNEIARSYEKIALEMIKIDTIKFVWITDGLGWRSAKRDLMNAFNTLEHIYNINDLNEGIFRETFI